MTPAPIRAPAGRRRRSRRPSTARRRSSPRTGARPWTSHARGHRIDASPCCGRVAMPPASPSGTSHIGSHSRRLRIPVREPVLVVDVRLDHGRVQHEGAAEVDLDPGPRRRIARRLLPPHGAVGPQLALGQEEPVDDGCGRRGRRARPGLVGHAGDAGEERPAVERHLRGADPGRPVRVRRGRRPPTPGPAGEAAPGSGARRASTSGSPCRTPTCRPPPPTCTS